MIRINLLEKSPSRTSECSLENTVDTTNVFDSTSSENLEILPKKSYSLLITLSIVGVVVLLGIFTLILFSHTSSNSMAYFPQKYKSQASSKKQQNVPTKNQSKQAISYAVDKKVQDTHKTIQKLRTENRSHYKKLSLSEKVHYQHYTINTLLNFIQESTLPSIKWKQLSIGTPGELYVSGIALNKKEYQKLLERLSKKKGIAIQKGIYRETKKGNVLFSLRGTLLWNIQSKRGTRILPQKITKIYLKKFKSIVETQGLKIKSFLKKKQIDSGSISQTTYQLVLTSSNTLAVQKLLKTMYISKSHMGISRLSIKESITLDLILYTSSQDYTKK